MRRLFAALLHILHLMPPAVAWSAGSRHVAWFASAVLVAAATVAIAQRGGAARRLLAAALTLSVAFANALLAVSFLVQGAGFNIEFFAHANRETLAFAAAALQPLLLVVSAYLSLALACPFLIPRAPAPRPIGPTAAAAAAGLALSAPAWSFGWHIANVVADVQSALWVPKPVLRLGREDGIAPRAPPLRRQRQQAACC